MKILSYDFQKVMAQPMRGLSKHSNLMHRFLARWLQKEN